jgi:Beta-lactamase.
MHALVDEQKLAGVTTLVARHGKVAHFDAYGKRDLTSGAPMEKDTIFPRTPGARGKGPGRTTWAPPRLVV